MILNLQKTKKKKKLQGAEESARMMPYMKIMKLLCVVGSR